MKFEGALIREQGITFGVAIVEQHQLRSTDRDKVVLQFSRIFRAPTVLMAQDNRGIPQYYGRKDIVNFLANVPLAAIPWREYNVS
ncbi:MAG: hypothetical protein K2X27_20415 [Candidatus Obscuribacterales bacterium]|nr:hypothetical protein [Candidatus Obscuribacterales bacterium]